MAHSTEAVVKPPTKSNEAAVREIEEAMQRVKQAQTMLSASVDPMGLMDTVTKDSKSSKSRYAYLTNISLYTTD